MAIYWILLCLLLGFSLTVNGQSCWDSNEFYSTCGPACEPNCATVNGGSCPQQIGQAACIAGCFCKRGLVRHFSGLCLPRSRCPQCQQNEVFMECGQCDPTCEDPGKFCAMRCKPDCYCGPNFVRNSTGQCVSLSECTGAV